MTSLSSFPMDLMFPIWIPLVMCTPARTGVDDGVKIQLFFPFPCFSEIF